MKKIIYAALLLLPLSMTRCIEDNSSYGGIELDEVTIEGIEKKYEIEIGSTLRISPVVTTKSGDTSHLSYVWTKFNGSQIVADTLSFEKDLDVVIGDILPGDANTLSFKVTDTKTGVFTRIATKLSTIGVYSGGTLMLCRTGTEYDLAMLKKDGKTLYENIYSNASNGEKLPADSKRLLFSDGDNRNVHLFRAVIVTSTDHEGGLYLDPVILKKKNDMRELFIFNEDLPSVLDITGYANGQGYDYLIVNGKLYGRPNKNVIWNISKNLWYPPAIMRAEPTDYSLAPCCIQFPGTPFFGTPVYYDNLNGRMIYSQGAGSFSFISGTNHDFTHFDPNKMGMGVEMVMCGNKNASIEQWWALMKNTDGTYFLIKFSGKSGDTNFDFKSESLTQLPRDSHPELYSMTAYVPGTKVKIQTSSPWGMSTYGESGFFFFVSGNRLYAFNILTASYGMLIDGAAEGFTITEVDCTEIADPTEDDPGASFNQLTLGVQEGGTRSGGIAVYKLSNIGGLTATKLYQMTGFCDEVVSTLEKQD